MLLTLATLRLPLAFTVQFTLIAVGTYLFVHVASVATGGKGLPLGTPVVR